MRQANCYFHNCICEPVYTDIRLNQKVSTQTLLYSLDADDNVTMVGDADMAPEELLDAGGAIYDYHDNQTPVIAWLRRNVWAEPGRVGTRRQASRP